MEIVGKIEVKGFLTCNDLDNGDVFTFLDDNVPYMLCSNDYADYIVSLSDGNIEELDNVLTDRPIRRLKAKLIIED